MHFNNNQFQPDSPGFSSYESDLSTESPFGVVKLNNNTTNDKTNKNSIIPKSSEEYYNEQLLKENREYMNNEGYTYCGQCYRKMCFSSCGLKISICINISMITLNTFLIIWEIILILKERSFIDSRLPLWYMICDLFITMVLLIEILFHISGVYRCNLCIFLLCKLDK